MDKVINNILLRSSNNHKNHKNSIDSKEDNTNENVENCGNSSVDIPNPIMQSISNKKLSKNSQFTSVQHDDNEKQIKMCTIELIPKNDNTTNADLIDNIEIYPEIDTSSNDEHSNNQHIANSLLEIDKEKMNELKEQSDDNKTIKKVNNQSNLENKSIANVLNILESIRSPNNQNYLKQSNTNWKLNSERLLLLDLLTLNYKQREEFLLNKAVENSLLIRNEKTSQITVSPEMMSVSADIFPDIEMFKQKFSDSPTTTDQLSENCEEYENEIICVFCKTTSNHCLVRHFLQNFKNENKLMEQQIGENNNKSSAEKSVTNNRPNNNIRLEVNKLYSNNNKETSVMVNNNNEDKKELFAGKFTVKQKPHEIIEGAQKRRKRGKKKSANQLSSVENDIIKIQENQKLNISNENIDNISVGKNVDNLECDFTIYDEYAVDNKSTKKIELIFQTDSIVNNNVVQSEIEPENYNHSKNIEQMDLNSGTIAKNTVTDTNNTTIDNKNNLNKFPKKIIKKIIVTKQKIKQIKEEIKVKRDIIPEVVKKSSNTTNDIKTIAEFNKHVKTVLEEVTINTIVDKCNCLQIKTIEQLDELIKIIFELAICKSDTCYVYAHLCKYLSSSKANVQTFDENINSDLFNKHIIKIAEEDLLLCDENTHKENSTDEVNHLENLKHITIAMIRFICELYKINVLPKNIILKQIATIMSEKTNYRLEYFYNLYITIGYKLEIEDNAKCEMDSYFLIISSILDNSNNWNIPNRLELLLKDLVVVRNNQWETTSNLKSIKTNVHSETMDSKSLDEKIHLETLSNNSFIMNEENLLIAKLLTMNRQQQDELLIDMVIKKDILINDRNDTCTINPKLNIVFSSLWRTNLLKNLICTESGPKHLKFPFAVNKLLIDHGVQLNRFDAIPNVIDNPENLNQLEKIAKDLETRKFGKIIEGTIRVNENDNTIAYLENSPDEDVRFDNIGLRQCALQNDIVRAFVFDKTLRESHLINKWRKTEGFVIRILKEVNNRMVVGKMTSDFKITPRDKRIPPVIVPKESLPNQFKHDCNSYYFVKIVKILPTLKYVGKIVEVLGKCDQLTKHNKMLLYQYDLQPNNYDDNIMKQLPPDNYKIPMMEYEKRKNLTSQCIFTIDPSTAKDLDDAVSCQLLANGNYEIGVHISDVTYFLKENTKLDNMVKMMTTSIYMVDTVYHMLPKPLCNLCSLLPNNDKLCFSVIFEITPDANILTTNFVKTIINSCSQLSYEHAQKMIDYKENIDALNDIIIPTVFNGFTQADILKSIKNLHAIAMKLRRKRFDNGALRFDRPKLLFDLHPNTNKPLSFEPYEMGESNWLIEEFMLLANQSVAKFCYDNFPETTILRNHAKPNIRQMKELQTILLKENYMLDPSDAKSISESYAKIIEQSENKEAKEIILNKMLAKPMPRAQYFCSSLVRDENDMKHFALAMPIYTHFTSPIRRYADCMVHRVLSGESTRSPDDLQTIALLCNTQKYNAKLAGEDCSNLYFIDYVKSVKSLTMRAVVYKLTDSYLQIVLILTGHLIHICFWDHEPKLTYKYFEESGTVNIALKDDTTCSDPKTLKLFSEIDAKIYVDNKNTLKADILLTNDLYAS